MYHRLHKRRGKAIPLTLGVAVPTESAILNTDSDFTKNHFAQFLCS